MSTWDNVSVQEVAETLRVVHQLDSGQRAHLVWLGTQLKQKLRQYGKWPAGAEIREMPYSEVCMHMHIAGRLMLVAPVRGGYQLYDLEGQQFSSPILPGEAGMHFSDLAVA